MRERVERRKTGREERGGKREREKTGRKSGHNRGGIGGKWEGAKREG